MRCFKVCLHREASAKVFVTTKVKVLHAHRKVMRTVHSRRVHRHVFRYALMSHFVDVAVSAGNISSFDRAVAFAAALGTLLLHLTECEEKSQEGAGQPGPRLWLDIRLSKGAYC